MTAQQTRTLNMIGLVTVLIGLLCAFTGNFSPLAGWLGGMALIFILVN